MWLHFVYPSQCRNIVWCKTECPRLRYVLWQKRQTDSDWDAKPQVSRSEKVVVIPIDRCCKPARRYNGVNSLNDAVKNTVTRLCKTPHGIAPNKHSSNEHCEEYPSGPYIGIETVVEVGRRDGNKYHRLVHKLINGNRGWNLRPLTVENSYKYTSNPSVLDDGEKYAYKIMK
jgi:hypothetical protein